MVRRTAGRSVEQRAGRIEWHSGRSQLWRSAAAGARGGHRIDGTEHVAMAGVERDRIPGANEVVLDGDHAAGEEALVELPGAARHVDGAVFAYAAEEVLQEGGCERGLIECAAASAAPRLGRCLA